MSPETPHVHGPDDRVLSVVVPMWNEEQMLPRTMAALGAELDLMVGEEVLAGYQIVLVDDASTDGTGALADVFAASDDRVTVCHHPENRKLGGAIRTGLAAVTGDLVLYTDADLPVDPTEIRKAIRLLDLHGADVVSAYRYHRMGEGPLRLVYSYLYNTLVHVRLGLRLRDVNFAFKLMRRWVVDKVELHSEGSFIDAELLARAQAEGAEIIQFGVDYFPRTRGISTLSSPGVILTILREMRSLSSELRRGSRPPNRR